MKKRALLFFMLILVFACVLTVCVSADETIDGITYAFSGSTARVTSANQNCTLEEVIIPEKVTDSNGKEYTVTELYGSAFRNNKTIKYVSLPSTITKISEAAFNSCSSLVFVDFNDNQNDVAMTGWGVFRGCTSLKAICLPDGMKTIGDQAFTGCTALTAVYLPARLEIIKGNKTAGDGPAFGNSPSMFLVSEKFEVRDENGKFYTPETFKIPQRPDVYYFPSTLKAITGAHNTSSNFSMDETGMVTNTGMEDCGFYNLPSINPVLVLPESYQGYDDRVLTKNEASFTEHRGDTINSGLFQKCSSQTKPLTVVFLGKIDRVSLSRAGDTQYTTYVFANEANTSLENTKIGTWYNTSSSDYKNQNEMYVVFCHSNTKYQIAFKGQENNTKYPVLTSELKENAQIHIASPANEDLISEPTCTTGKIVNTVCFCGAPVGEGVEDKNTILGHEHSVSNGASVVKICYDNGYTQNGYRLIKCARCEITQEGDVTQAILGGYKGFSVPDDVSIKGITIGYDINEEALDEFKLYDKNAEFGYVFALDAFLNGEAPLNDDGSTKLGVIKTEMDMLYQRLDLVIRGNIWDSEINIDGVLTPLSRAEIFMCAYARDENGISYIQNGNMSASEIVRITYDELLN